MWIKEVEADAESNGWLQDWSLRGQVRTHSTHQGVGQGLRCKDEHSMQPFVLSLRLVNYAWAKLGFTVAAYPSAGAWALVSWHVLPAFVCSAGSKQYSALCLQLAHTSSAWPATGQSTGL
jgi:hypothetical protein